MEKLNKIPLVEFAEDRKVKMSTVHMFIRNHEDELEGHISKYKNKLMLDEVAYSILDKAYPVPVVEYVEDKESRAELMMQKDSMVLMKERYNKLQKELDEVRKEQITMLTEYQGKLEEQAEKLEAKHRDDLDRVENIYKEQIDFLRTELEKERSKGFFARLFGK